jgi:hypothetical protein
MTECTRRGFMKSMSLAASAAATRMGLNSLSNLASALETPATDSAADRRRSPVSFHICAHPVEFMENPDLGKLLVENGIEKVWLAGYFYGQWSYDRDKLLRAKSMAEAAGLRTALVNVPLGHPGNSLGEVDKLVPLTIPPHWRYRLNVDGQEVRHCGCLNDASWQDNLGALREARRIGFHEVFMDDDLRLAVGPGVIGGCFCSDCISRYRQQTGASDRELDEIRKQVKGRIRGEALVRWLKFHGGRLTAFLDDCNSIAGDLSVGIMVMYMGNEQAGIELARLRRRLFRVGEGHFDNGSFGNPHGKLVALASAMFHRRYADRSLAFSESTAFPPTGLSAENLGRKIAVPMMADVPNVMFMSGIRMFPKTYWPTLSEHIRHARRLDRELPSGPPTGALKLWFGPGVRSVAASWPLVDCLGLGIPVEAITQVTPGGAYLVQAEDVPFLPENVLTDPKTAIVTCSTPKPPVARCRWIDVGGDWPARWRAKEAILEAVGDVPHIAGATPTAVRWYRNSNKLLVWNINETEQTMEMVCGPSSQRVKLAPGELRLAES